MFARVTLVVSALALAPGLAIAQQKSDQGAAEQQIRKLGQQWVEAVQAKDAKAIADLYAEDGMVMPPNATLAQGRDAVEKVWQGLLQLPDFSLDFEPTVIKVAEGGDMAYDVGTYTLSFKAAQGSIEDEGKYVVVWTNEDGDWKAAADIFNSNLPAAPMEK